MVMARVTEKKKERNLCISRSFQKGVFFIILCGESTTPPRAGILQMEESSPPDDVIYTRHTARRVKGDITMSDAKSDEIDATPTLEPIEHEDEEDLLILQATMVEDDGARYSHEEVLAELGL